LNDNDLDDASKNVDSEDDLKSTCGYEVHYPLMLSANMVKLKNSARIIPWNCCKFCTLNKLSDVKHAVYPQMFV